MKMLKIPDFKSRNDWVHHWKCNSWTFEPQSWKAIIEGPASQGLNFPISPFSGLNFQLYSDTTCVGCTVWLRSQLEPNGIAVQIFIAIQTQTLKCIILTQEIQLSCILEQQDFLGHSVIQINHFCLPPVYIQFKVLQSYKHSKTKGHDFEIRKFQSAEPNSMFWITNKLLQRYIWLKNINLSQLMK